MVERAAYSIAEFCEAHSISEPFYFVLKKQGKAPQEMAVGTRRTISLEAAARWRRAREREARRGAAQRAAG
jgi:hypothetical protein